MHGVAIQVEEGEMSDRIDKRTTYLTERAAAQGVDFGTYRKGEASR